MPAQGVVSTGNSNEVPAVVPTVEIDGGIAQDGMQARDFVSVMAIEDRIGLIPSSAEIKFGNVGYDLTGPNTLNAWQLFDLGARVNIFDGDETLFLGGLWKRRDQGLSDSLVWSALDDRLLLWKIPVRGAIVYDEGEIDSTKRIKFISGYTPRFNPNGFWNCCFASLEEEHGNVPIGTYPIFKDVAHKKKSYETPDEAFLVRPIGDSGVETAWTPRRVLQYLWLLANLPGNSIQGTFDGRWRSLAVSTRLTWSNDIANMVGKDPSDLNTDPLDRKMPDSSFRGMKMAGAIQHTLNVCGTHDIAVDYGKTDADELITQIKFIPDGFSGTVLPTFMDINLQRGGNCNDPNTGFDFDVYEDASELMDCSFIEGARHCAEGRVEYTNGATTDTLKPFWTTAQETCFQNIICGDPSTSNTSVRYAWYPNTLGSETNSLLADGNGSPARPLVYAGTPEAIQFARGFFPRVYKAFRFNFTNTYNNALLLGANNAFSNESIYPKLYDYQARKALPHQLQYMLSRLSGTSNDEQNQLLQKFPIRFEVDRGDSTNAATKQYFDAQCSIHFSDDGTIWLEAAEERDGRPDCIYKGGLLYLSKLTDTNGAAVVSLKSFRLNIAVPLDHRVSGYKEIPPTWSVLADKLWTDLGGPFMDYVDSPGAYREDHQVESRPSPYSQYYAGETVVDATNDGLTRILPPGTEKVHAEYAAQRRLAQVRWPIRRSSWKMIGIRTDYRAGTWIRNVTVYGHENPDVEDADYNIWAPLKSVVYDFDHQMTILGGLISQLSYSRGLMTRGEQHFHTLEAALETAQAVDRAPRIDPLMKALKGTLGLDGETAYA